MIAAMQTVQYSTSKQSFPKHEIGRAAVTMTRVVGLLINATCRSRKLERAIPDGMGWSYPANRCALAPWRAGWRARRTFFSRGKSRIVMSALTGQGLVQSSITTGPSPRVYIGPRESEITSTGPVLAQQTHNLQSIDVT